jgi:hypothetical protein
MIKTLAISLSDILKDYAFQIGLGQAICLTPLVYHPKNKYFEDLNCYFNNPECFYKRLVSLASVPTLFHTYIYMTLAISSGEGNGSSGRRD